MTDEETHAVLARGTKLDRKLRLGDFRNRIFQGDSFLVARHIICEDDSDALEGETVRQRSLAEDELSRLVASNGFEQHQIETVQDWFVKDLRPHRVCDMAANSVVEGVCKLLVGEFVIQ